MTIDRSRPRPEKHNLEFVTREEREGRDKALSSRPIKLRQIKGDVEGENSKLDEDMSITHLARVSINRVRLPILLVVS